MFDIKKRDMFRSYILKVHKVKWFIKLYCSPVFDYYYLFSIKVENISVQYISANKLLKVTLLKCSLNLYFALFDYFAVILLYILIPINYYIKVYILEDLELGLSILEGLSIRMKNLSETLCMCIYIYICWYFVKINCL